MSRSSSTLAKRMKIALGAYQIAICLFCLPPILMFRDIIGLDFFLLSILVFTLVSGIALFFTKLIGFYLMLVTQLLQIISFRLEEIEYLNAQGLILGFKFSQNSEVPEKSIGIDFLGIIGSDIHFGPVTDPNFLFSVNVTAIVLSFLCVWLIKKGANQPAQVNPCNPPENPRTT